MRQRGFAHTRQIFYQQVAARKQATQGQPYLVFLAQQYPPDLTDRHIYGAL
jgi:hypothetical protein